MTLKIEIYTSGDGCEKFCSCCRTRVYSLAVGEIGFRAHTQVRDRYFKVEIVMVDLQKSDSVIGNESILRLLTLWLKFSSSNHVKKHKRGMKVNGEFSPILNKERDGHIVK